MDQYKTNAEVEPGLGWVAVKGYYVGMPGNTDGLAVLDDYLVADQSSSFKEDFLDYTLALYAYIYNPADPRLAFIDAEINSEAVGLSGHTVVSNNQAYSEQTATVQPRSSQYWEYIPPGTCPFVAFTFEENDSSKFGFSVMTVDNSGDLQDRWTSLSSQWARTVSTSGLSRVVGVISGLEGDPDSNVTHWPRLRHPRPADQSPYQRRARLRRRGGQPPPVPGAPRRYRTEWERRRRLVERGFHR